MFRCNHLRCLLACLLLVAWLAAYPMSAEAGEKISSAVQQEITDQGRAVVFVEIDPGVDSIMRNFPTPKAIAAGQDKVLSAMSNQPGWKLKRRLESIPYLLCEVDAGGLAGLAAIPEVLQIDPDLAVQGALAQSALAIGATTAHQNNIKGDGVVVGIIDTGIDQTQPDLQNAVMASRRFLNQVSDVGTTVTDDNGHGSHLCGIITSDGIAVPQGIAPNSKLVVVKALDKDNRGYISDVVSGLDWIVANRASFPSLKFVNMSLVLADVPAQFPCDNLPGLTAFVTAINNAKNNGILVVTASGNDGEGFIRAPACFSSAISVGAVFDDNFARAPETGTYGDAASNFPYCYDVNGQVNTLPCFTGRRPGLTLLAPGYNITSVDIYGGAIAYFGTSQAAAHATAAFALLQQRQPLATAPALVETMKTTGKNVTDPENPANTYKRIDVAAALGLTGSAAQDWEVYD